MKHTSQKMLVGVVATAFLLSGVSFPVLAAENTSLLDALSGSTGTAVASAELKVKGLSALPDNESVQLLWDPVTFEGKKITIYQILYGTKSVEEGLADSYDGGSIKVEADTSTGIAKYTVPKLQNGQKYFFTVKAVKPDGKVADIAADEKSATPGTDIKSSTNTSGKSQEPLSLKESTAITKNFVKIEFSKMVEIPKDLKPEEEKTLFRITKKGSNEEVEIRDVIFRTNYFLSEAELATKSVTKDTVVYVQVPDLQKDSEYTVTVNAGVKGEDGKPIASGAADSYTFKGTDLTTLPDTEKESVQKPSVPTTQSTGTDPLSTMFLSGSEKKDEGLKAAPPEDKLSPEEIEALKIEAKERAKDFLLTLSWAKSKNTAGDLLKQILYVSLDKAETKKWEKVKELNGDVTTVPFTAKPDTEYYFKITTMDKAGNESTGVIQKYKVPALVATGSPMFLTLGLALMGGALLAFQRRKFLF